MDHERRWHGPGPARRAGTGGLRGPGPRGEPHGPVRGDHGVTKRRRDGVSPALRRRLVDLRQDLHRHPELAFEERETAKRLEAELARLKPAELRRVAGT